MLKSSKGITLVALVVTIIVLLILAGVTISIVINQNILDRSNEVVDKYQNRALNETNTLEWVVNEIERLNGIYDKTTI